MTEVYLLQGPDGNRYTAKNNQNDTWTVSSFSSFMCSDWWKTQCSYPSWKQTKNYTLEEIKETFSILAKTETQLSTLSDVIFHYD